MGVLIQVWSLLTHFIVRCSGTSRDEQGFCFLICHCWAGLGCLDQFCCSYALSQQNFTSVVLGNAMLRGDFESSLTTNRSFCPYFFLYVAVSL